MKLLYFLVLLLCVSCSRAQSVVVELFTSEGCSSCPPAEDVFNKLSKEAQEKNQNTFFLEFHVDYWNRLGWMDPYSKRIFTTRQENYSRVLGDKELYTPQVVVNGKRECIGSKEKLVRENIQSALNEKDLSSIGIKVDSTLRDTVFVSYSTSKSGAKYSLRFALTESGLTSKIGKGENSGRTLQHDNVVRIFTSLDSPAEKGNYKIPLKGLKPNDSFKLIVFLQEKGGMAISGATTLGF